MADATMSWFRYLTFQYKTSIPKSILPILSYNTNREIYETYYNIFHTTLTKQFLTLLKENDHNFIIQDNPYPNENYITIENSKYYRNKLKHILLKTTRQFLNTQIPKTKDKTQVNIRLSLGIEQVRPKYLLLALPFINIET